MENQAMKVVSRFVTAVQQGDQETIADLLHPEIQWHQPGKNRFSGTKNSSNEVFQMVGGMFEISENTFALTDIKFLGLNGDTVASVLHFKATRPNAVLDVDNIDVYKVKDGKIVSATIYSDDIDQENSFWGN